VSCLWIGADSLGVRPSWMTRAAVATLATAATAFALPATASALALSVTTSSPQDIATSRATMRAKVSVSVLGASVTWQYGTTTAYGATSGAVSSALLGVDQTVTVAVSGLAPDTTYHVRAVATSGLSTAYGRDVSFKTAKDSSGSGSSGSGSSDSGSSGSGSSGSGDDGSGDDNSGSGSTPSTTAPSTTAVPPAATAKGPQASPAGRTPTPIPADGGSPAGAVPADDASTAAPGVATATLTPVFGKTLGAAATHGTVTATDPSGTTVDLGAATVELKTALDRKGATQTGHFWGGVFEVRQSATARGLTQLVLRGGDFSDCKTTNKAVARAATKATKKKRKPKPRSLWGSDDHGRFETRGRGSVATVRGTHWLTQDTCAGTLTRVLAGAVAVKDLRGGRTVVVTRGHQYLARMTP
jgi:hypothetical protein